MQFGGRSSSWAQTTAKGIIGKCNENDDSPSFSSQAEPLSTTCFSGRVARDVRYPIRTRNPIVTKELNASTSARNILLQVDHIWFRYWSSNIRIRNVVKFGLGNAPQMLWLVINHPG